MSTITAGNVTVSCSLSADTTGNLVFQSGGNVTAMTIDTSQNVGIGTSSPGYKLDVNGSASFSNSRAANTYVYASSGNYCGIGFYSDVTLATRTAVLETQTGTATILKTENATPLILSTNNTERMRIQSGGIVNFQGSATPANSGAFTTSYGTTVWTFGGQAGTGSFLVQNASSVGVYITSGATSWTGTSDGRLKEVIGKVENGLSKILAMNPVKFTWKHDEETVKDVHIGFIAQEVQEIEPDIVEVESNGNLGITYTEIIPLLTAAIQEQQQMIETLQAEVAALKGASA